MTAFEFLSVNTIAFEPMGYPLSYVELAGTVLYLASVWLIARRNMLTWPIGIASVLLYMALFYQIGLYSDTLEQIYYLAANAYGWRHWSVSRQTLGSEVRVEISGRRELVLWAAATVLLSIATGWLMSRVHLLLPGVFPQPASYPYVDALTTVMSFVAMWLMARRRTESWVYWILVDAIAIWLYSVKQVRFVALLYVLLLALALRGLLLWAGARPAHRAALS